MNTNEFQPALIKAEDACRLFDKAYPNDRMVQSIIAQLEFLKKWDHSGMKWTDEKLKKLNFGILASKAVDAENRSLAQLLYELANYIDENRRS